MCQETPNYLPAILGTSIAVLWLLHKSLLIGFPKEYEKYTYKVIKWLKRKQIVLPTMIVLAAPFILTWMALPQYELTGLYKQSLLIFTFILGVIIAKTKDNAALREKNRALFVSLLMEFEENSKVLIQNKKIIENRQYRPLKALQTNALNSLIENLPKQDPTRLVKKFRALKDFIRELDELNFSIEKANSTNSLESRMTLLTCICNLLEDLPKLKITTLFTIIPDYP
ncbi:hypothetical protein [Floridanema aerugineum]|uniref:Uncharacterized protein n=1 Tax=Floridaenema aerugineum BLCC-F46 TaxID=3153654 RepID=A0ABV4X5Y6_9CYAN